ncbi:16S rRNA (cytosine(1402)-N(4))-methyltransferase RsmH [bacterium]|nr:16S rRNA (cytosine(1402)-N(4))-methyltransferase RsmH [bacterium]
MALTSNVNTVKYHEPVLLESSIEGLKLRRWGRYVDGTLGGGGHTCAILNKLSEIGEGTLFSIDRDKEAIEEARRVIGQVGQGVTFKIFEGNFSSMKSLLSDELSGGGVDGVLLDLGVSSHQLDCAQRGFSFRYDAPLDMRMAPAMDTLSASDIVNTYSCSALKDIIKNYGEERFASGIAKAICKCRDVAPLQTTKQLAELICSVVPHSSNSNNKQIHPATRTFQALRIAVNDELESLKRGLEEAIELLSPGGRLVVISYHSLEDRIVKQAIRSRLGRCTCPHDVPVCVCSPRAVLREITHHPVVADKDELVRNPRARSAKLRVAEKIG